jgi:hypothetical protein
MLNKHKNSVIQCIFVSCLQHTWWLSRIHITLLFVIYRRLCFHSNQTVIPLAMIITEVFLQHWCNSYLNYVFKLNVNFTNDYSVCKTFKVAIEKLSGTYDEKLLSYNSSQNLRIGHIHIFIE